MRHIYLLVFLLMACDPTGSTSSNKVADPVASNPTTNRIVFFGDNTLKDSTGVSYMLSSELGKTLVDCSRNYDGSNGAMIYGFQSLWTGCAIQDGDTVIYMAGIYDAKWYGAADPSNQAQNMLKTFLNLFISKNIKVYIATVPRLPAAGYATGAPLNNGSNAAMDFYTTQIKNAVTAVNSSKITVVDLNADLAVNAANFQADGTTFSTVGFQALKTLFKAKIQ